MRGIKEAHKMRLFISVEIPEYIKKEIVRIQDNLPEFKGKIIKLENLHLTLKFLGEVDEEKIKKIKEKLSEIQFKRFEAEIDFIGVFSKKAIRIVWLHIKNCEKLQKEIDEKLENLFEKENRFMGHLTIARVKTVENKEEFLNKLKRIKIPRITFVVDKFNLKKSVLTGKGPIYSDIDTYELKI